MLIEPYEITLAQDQGGSRPSGLRNRRRCGGEAGSMRNLFRWMTTW